MLDISQHPWKCAWMTTSLLLQRKPNDSSFKTKPLSKAVQHTAYHYTHRKTLFSAMQNLTSHGKHTNFPRETVPARKREIYGYRYIQIRDHHFDQLSEQVPCTQHTHTSGYRLQAKESSSELPTTEDGKFQHEDISTLQHEC